MDYSQIRRFLAIVKYGSLSETAKELYISQPALSLSLSNLEKELGLKLFYRGRSGLVLTREGEALYDKFQGIQDAFESLEEEKQKLQQKEDNTISLGCIGSPLHFLGFFVNDFLEYDGWKVQTVCAERSLMVDMLHNGQIDFLITAPPMEDQAVGNINLYREKVIVVTSSGHPLSSKGGLRLSDLKNEKFYSLSQEIYFRNLCDRLCRSKGFEPQYVFEGAMGSFYSEIRRHRGKDDFIAFCASDSFDTMYGEGFVRHELEDVDFTHKTVLSYMVDRKLQYKYADFVRQLVDKYPAQRMFHEVLLKILMDNLPEIEKYDLSATGGSGRTEI